MFGLRESDCLCSFFRVWLCDVVYAPVVCPASPSEAADVDDRPEGWSDEELGDAGGTHCAFKQSPSKFRFSLESPLFTEEEYEPQESGPNVLWQKRSLRRSWRSVRDTLFFPSGGFE